MEHIKDYKLFKESLDTELITERFSSDILRQFASQDGKSRWRGNIAKDMQKFANLALDKISDAINAKGNVKVYDPIENYTIESEEIDYYRKLEKIITDEELIQLNIDLK